MHELERDHAACLKGSATINTTNTNNDTGPMLTGTFSVQVSGHPQQELSVRISIKSDYSTIGGSPVKLGVIPNSVSHQTSQAKVQHFAGIVSDQHCVALLPEDRYVGSLHRELLADAAGGAWNLKSKRRLRPDEALTAAASRAALPAD